MDMDYVRNQLEIDIQFSQVINRQARIARWYHELPTLTLLWVLRILEELYTIFSSVLNHRIQRRIQVKKQREGV